MILSKQKKTQNLDIIKNAINKFSAVLCINYSNFPVEKIEHLRDEFFAKNCPVIFVKNSLVSIACNDNCKNHSDAAFKESNMLVFSDDIFSLISSINQFTKSLKKGYANTKLSISCGVLDQGIINSDTIKRLSSIPSINSLHVNLVRILNSPLEKLVKICNNPMIDLLKILDLKSKN
jgi:large subunit ribosomal protein L10